MATKKSTTRSKTKNSTVKKQNAKKTSANSTTKAAITKVSKTNQKSWQVSLRYWNIGLAIIFVLQAIAIFLIGKAVTLPVVTNYLTNDALASKAAGHTVLAPAVRQLFDFDIRYLILVFLLVSAITYALIATVWRTKYEAGLQKKSNAIRWIQQGLTAALMFVLISMLNGIYAATALLAVVVLVGVIHFLGFFGESKVADWRSKLQTFVAVCVSGATVWIIIGLYLKGAIMYGTGLSKYVYWIDGLVFVVTLGLGYNKLQSLRAQGRWADYLFAERLYMILGFVAQTALAWLVFAGFLK
jgi:hypothetical protein